MSLLLLFQGAGPGVDLPPPPPPPIVVALNFLSHGVSAISGLSAVADIADDATTTTIGRGPTTTLQ